MTLSWVGILLALIPAMVVLTTMYYLLAYGHYTGAGGARLSIFITLGAIGFVGYIFTKYVKKERYQVNSCTRCAYQQIEKLPYDNSVEL